MSPVEYPYAMEQTNCVEDFVKVAYVSTGNPSGGMWGVLNRSSSQWEQVANGKPMYDGADRGFVGQVALYWRLNLNWSC